MRNNVIFLGCTSNYGYGYSANNTKIDFLARGLYEAGDKCTIINSIIGLKGLNGRKIIEKDYCKVISYQLHINQIISWIFNLIAVYKDLKQLYQKGDGNELVLEAPDYHIYLLYVFLGKILNYKISVISHEWLPTVKSIHFIRKPSVWLYTKTFGYFADGILPISEYIIKKIEHFKKPFLKVPVLAEFNEMPLKNKCEDRYFLYCVYALYARVIEPIIDAYGDFINKTNSAYRLILVLSGKDSYVQNIQDIINRKQLQNNIIIKRNLSYEDLINHYVQASGLIIPLDPNSKQDYARFSQKIAEYTSSASPIISCKVGEVDYYFKDKESAVLCDYSKDGFVNAFTWISENIKTAETIGYNGYKLGEKNFNYRVVGEKLSIFLDTL